MFAIFGTGGFGRELVRPAQAMLGQNSGQLVFVTDHPEGPVLGIPVLAPHELAPDATIVIAVGDSVVRREIASRLTVSAGKLIAPTALIGPDVEIGPGAVFCDFTMVTASARIGRHFHCNIYSYLAHDCVLGDFVTFAPSVCCNGNVHIGDNVYVGTGAVIRQGRAGDPLTIGEGAVIGMGAVVTKDVPPGVTVVGNPARLLER
jgi:sugar O-acyltransferase (sialic acid O-acetyltransferase NeuD family)